MSETDNYLDRRAEFERVGATRERAAVHAHCGVLPTGLYTLPMKLPLENAELRQALDLPPLDSYSHRDEVRRLHDKYGHSIQYEGIHEAETCVPFALELTDDPAYEGIRHAYQAIFAGPDFMAWMIRREHLLELSTPKVGCLVCYFSAGNFEHVGVMLRNNRVRSKWGRKPRYSHDLAEVPATYGNCLKFYERPAAETSRCRFREFALEQGLTEGNIAAAIEARP